MRNIPEMRSAVNGEELRVDSGALHQVEKLLRVMYRVGDVLRAVDERDRTPDACEGLDGMRFAIQEELRIDGMKNIEVLQPPIPYGGGNGLGR
jgi:hypothetical protein